MFDSMQVVCTVRAYQSTIELYGRTIDLTRTNLILLDGRQGGQPSTWPIRLDQVELPATRDPWLTTKSLTAAIPVATFLAETA
jgi:hypothetical protein